MAKPDMSLPYHEYVEIEMVCDILWGYPRINPVVDASAGKIVDYRSGRVQQDEHFMYRGALACAPRTWAHAVKDKDQERIHKAQAEKFAALKVSARKEAIRSAKLAAGIVDPEMLKDMEAGGADGRFVPIHRKNEPTRSDPLYALRQKAKSLNIKRAGNMGEDRLKAEIAQAEMDRRAEEADEPKERASDAVAGSV